MKVVVVMSFLFFTRQEYVPAWLVANVEKTNILVGPVVVHTSPGVASTILPVVYHFLFAFVLLHHNSTDWLMVGVAVMSTGEPDPTVIVVAGCEATEEESVGKIKDLRSHIYTLRARY